MDISLLTEALKGITEQVKEKAPEKGKELDSVLKQLDSKFAELNKAAEQLKDIQSKL